jgi:kumamolisin
MRPSPVGRRGQTLGWVAALAVALLLSTLIPVIGPTGTAVATPSPGNEAATFAASTGYSPNLLAHLTDPSVASGTTSVVVTFRPTSPTLFDVPPSGARPLTVAQIGAEFGLSPAAYRQAEAYFVAEGLTIEHAGADRLSLTIEGSAPAIDRAFATTLVQGTYEHRAVRLPETAPTLPSGLESEVAGVTGLSSGFDQFSLPLVKTGLVPDAGPTQGSSDLITPSIARQIYAASSLYNFSGASHFATGQNIVLLLWGDGYSPSDLTTFFSTDYPTGEFPSVTVNSDPIDGAPAPSTQAVNDPSGAPEELTLDLEWSGSLAPGATLTAVYAPDGPSSDNYSPTDASMADALHAAVTGVPGVDAISMSFGTAESTSSGLASAWSTDLAEAAQEQITLLAATGDTGGDTSITGGCSGTAQADYPASDPGVIAVGGTDPSLARNPLGAVTGISSESAWADSGGGFSTVYPAPSWQLVGSAVGPIHDAGGFRGMPDVSATAADNFVYYDGLEQTGAGTSFATPLWAGLVTEMDALRGSPLGFLTPRLYYVGSSEPNGTVANGLVDVTRGATCLGPATRGWDTATGWGSPRASLLYADLTSTFVNLSLHATPSPVGPGASLTVQAYLANSSTRAPIAGVTVVVTVTADTTFGPCDGTFGTADPTTNESGVISVPISIPACYLGTRAIVSVAVMSSGLFGSNQTTVGVNLLGDLGFLGSAASYPNDVVVYVLIMAAAIAIGYVLGRGPPRRRASRSRVPPSVGPPPPSDVPNTPGPTGSPPPPESSASAWVLGPSGGSGSEEPPPPPPGGSSPPPPE